MAPTTKSSGSALRRARATRRLALVHSKCCHSTGGVNVIKRSFKFLEPGCSSATRWPVLMTTSAGRGQSFEGVSRGCWQQYQRLEALYRKSPVKAQNLIVGPPEHWRMYDCKNSHLLRDSVRPGRIGICSCWF